MSKIISNILQRSGTGQELRYIEALNPENFELHDFTIEDWILFAYNFAKKLNYFPTENHEVASGDWQHFFKKLTTSTIPFRGTREYNKLKENIQTTLEGYTQEGKLSPHLTLFVCFLKLLEHSKERFNNLTKRHLDFYYKEILQVQKREPIPDQAHVIFELAKKITDERIEEGTLLDAKKDSLGNPLVYETEEELIVNKASVGVIKTIYNNNTAELKKIKVSEVANTKDGIEEELPEDEPYWYPFGYPASEKNATELPDAELGFSIASPMLWLQEGDRTVTVTINFKNNFEENSFDVSKLLQAVQIFGSGKEKWIEPILVAINNVNDGVLITTNQISFKFSLGYDSGALVGYNEEFLLTKYNTSHPLVRFEFDVSTTVGYDFYRFLAGNVLEKITIKTDVKGVKSATVENDNGVVRTKKPFHPFTTRPIEGSNFSVSYNEAFSKKWNNFTVNLRWKNTPNDFKEWYQAYLKPSSYSSIETYGDELGEDIDSRELIIEDHTYFKTKKRLLHAAGEAKETIGEVQNLLKKEVDEESEEITYTSEFKAKNTGSSYEIDKAGPLQLTLEQSFLHQLYPKLYALAVSAEDKGINLPNEPYTPLVESISVDYIAEETIVMENMNLEGNRIQLFHEHPFGQHEENYAEKKYLQEEKNIIDVFDKDTVQAFLVPKYCLGGHLFLGIENVEPQQNLSLLIQVLEGSENPLVESFEENEKIQWSILCNNKWKTLENNIITNNTDNFLKSGIVKFSIPKEATSNNTLLPSGYTWIRAQMNKSYDAVCKAIGIHAQAVLTTFKNNDNEVNHLKNGLPSETIKKMVTRIPKIKSVSQPYNAFGGSTEESDANFYRRISERLRHKNRAITLWDYEHLILQEFPEIYKVKCLNHTSETSFTAAGHVTLIVVPDTVNKNVFDMYQPRVSKATLNSVMNYINSLNTLHVKAEVINPNYEEITIGLEVSFYEGYDENYYTEQLKTDITKFLSPWAFDETKEVTFGIMLHKSILIDYLEKLTYVDYLQNVTMNGDAKVYKIEPSNPKSILVSAKTHNVSTVLTTCKGTKKIIEQTCQL
ncbi:baseplate J/gp47 family protein [Tenacibaculum sp. Mcav3-52]|uniref:baseplate J/gp47 family protein n=1 Tax=Tenacibaculum sp. Mcav3-52 TaxID=2917762 RepID=UPI001EF2F6BF|nr:baseplate J/gp47 family protein [Tenacibaculum sp. Mcav3-52]MCG7501115.1 baseplate J/gp47 family protein [Tenacibaculum sp. Mcav3-52]